MSVIPLSYTDLLLSSMFIVLIAIASWRQKYAIEKRLVFSTLRMTVQLVLIGWVIHLIFAYSSLPWILLISLIMLFVATREAFIRQKRPLKGWKGVGIGLGAMALSTYLVTFFALGIILQPDPWYDPQYSIPLLGMILGNMMTAVALVTDHVTTDAWDKREEIEQKLLMGQTAKEAFSETIRRSLGVAMTPMLNSMIAAGIIHLPGMMTGQILAGNSPTEAAKYQIFIFLLITGALGISCLFALWLTERELFDHRDRLRLDRIKNKT